MTSRRVAAGLAFALTAAAAAGCGEEESARVCTQIGCASAVTVVLEEPPPERARVRACVADTCRTVRAARGRVRIPLDGQAGDRQRVRVTVRVEGSRAGASGEVALQRSRPNGPDCPPVCLSGTAFYDARSDRLRSA